MSAGVLATRADARALKARYGALLSPGPTFVRPDLDEVVDRLSAAQRRVCGPRDTPDRAQLTLELHRS